MPKKVKVLSDPRTVREQQAEFLEQFGEYGSVSRACRLVDVARSNIYHWLKIDPEFKKAYDAACVLAVAALEDEAIRRAHEGTVKPVFQGGKKVGVIREFSDTLLIFLLKGMAPEKYKDRVANEHTGKDGAPIKQEVTVRVLQTGVPIAGSEDDVLNV